MQLSINANLQQLKGSQTQQINQVSKQFEALFWQQALQAMRGATSSLASSQSSNTQMFTQMYDTELSQTLAEHNCLGFGKIIAKQSNPHKLISFDGIVSHPKAISHNQDCSKIAQTNFKSSNSADHRQSFIENLIPHATKSAQKLGVKPNFIIAQAALETNWGRQMRGNNLFGIKSHNWSGKNRINTTYEVRNGKWQKESASFRGYHDWKQSCEDYVNFLQNNPRYKKALQVAHNGEKFAHELQKAGYATDPNYAHKIKQIAHTVNQITQNQGA